MPKAKRMIRGQKRYAAFATSENQPGQRRGPDGQFLKVGALPAVVVVTETRQQRRHLARQAVKGGKS